MGQKTSVYLSDELLSRWKASALPLSEIIRRGLDAAGQPDPAAEALRRVIRQELGAHRETAPAAEPAPRKTAPRTRPAPVAAPAAPRPDAAREVPFSGAPDPCPHPKSRVIKGYCGHCGTHVG